MSKFVKKKYLGQNFLNNKKILEKIANLKEFKNQTILEIGPGKGAFTEFLLNEKPKKLIAVEKDHQLEPFLINLQNKYPHNFKFFLEDALNFDFQKMKNKKFYLVANLPYNIATTLIISWLRFIDIFKSIIIMVQKEVAERVAAPVSSKSYGRTSVLVQLHCDVKKMFDVSPENFDPKPKVYSSVIELQPKKGFQFDYHSIDKALKICFSHRRKKLKNNLKDFNSCIIDQIKNHIIDLELRPQDLKINEYIILSKLLTN